jgi:hypothetical protein
MIVEGGIENELGIAIRANVGKVVPLTFNGREIGTATIGPEGVISCDVTDPDMIELFRG